MSIAAKIVGVTGRHGEWRLTLEPNSDSPAGQSRLLVVNPPDPPEKLEDLLHLDVWGGSGNLMCGEERLAKRIGYTRIRLCDGWALIAKEAHEQTARCEP